MRVISFAVAASVLMLVKGDCQYNELTQQATNDIWECLNVDAGTELKSCNEDYQGRLEDAVATYIYQNENPQCKCVYYDDTLAFTYKQGQGCWKIRGAVAGLKCWTTELSDYATSGALATKLNEIGCNSLPAPDCADDAAGVLTDFPMTCPMFITVSGGCDAEPHPTVVPGDHGYETVADICKGSCNSQCNTNGGGRGDSCVDDPLGELAAHQSSCQQVKDNPLIGCEDFNNLVLETYNATPAEICPASCEPSCQ